MALLSVENLSTGYGSHVVVENLNFTINSGDYLCIIGENGSGKTTLMKTLLGLQPPVSGQITTGDGLQNNEIGYLPQQSSIQRDFPASVKEIVLSGCQSKKKFFYSKEEIHLAEKNMEITGITHLSKKSYKELSGGQQQRVLLARALCATKKLLLLDEPVSGLDPLAVTEMYSLINELNKNKITIIMISHDIPTALEYASHVLYIGHKIFFGKKEEYLNQLNMG